tara:strand:- start:2657 stop:2911 length:255 start_codon:yes stop_codon:yes gene_type:complete
MLINHGTNVIGPTGVSNAGLNHLTHQDFSFKGLVGGFSHAVAHHAKLGVVGAFAAATPIGSNQTAASTKTGRKGGGLKGAAAVI